MENFNYSNDKIHFQIKFVELGSSHQIHVCNYKDKFVSWQKL